MKSGHVDTDYLQDMLDACIKATDFIRVMSFQDFVSDEKTQFAVIRALEIVGEASKKISQGFKDQNPEIHWKVIAGMRDKMIHDYMGVNKTVVWKTIIEDIPPFVDQLRKAIETS
jgi:uncharacterized protein with HEPN domain